MHTSVTTRQRISFFVRRFTRPGCRLRRFPGYGGAIAKAAATALHPWRPSPARRVPGSTGRGPARHEEGSYVCPLASGPPDPPH